MAAWSFNWYADFEVVASQYTRIYSTYIFDFSPAYV